MVGYARPWIFGRQEVSYGTSACSCLLSTDLGMFVLVRAELGISRELGISNHLESERCFRGSARAISSLADHLRALAELGIV